MLPEGIERGGELTAEELRSLADDVQIVWVDRDDYNDGWRDVVQTVGELRAEDRRWGSGEGDPYADGYKYYNIAGAVAVEAAEARAEVNGWWDRLTLEQKKAVRGLAKPSQNWWK